jgi:Carboxylesterase family
MKGLVTIVLKMQTASEVEYERVRIPGTSAGCGLNQKGRARAARFMPRLFEAAERIVCSDFLCAALPPAHSACASFVAGSARLAVHPVQAFLVHLLSTSSQQGRTRLSRSGRPKTTLANIGSLVRRRSPGSAVISVCLSLVVFCCVCFAPSPSQDLSAPLATIDSGPLEGAYFGASPDEVMFLGIPYAAPPIADRRWKPPQPVAKWQGARKAVAYGAACPQAEDPHQQEITKEMIQTFEPYFTYRTDEDCLYLNLWTSNLPTAHRGAARLPVMIWIHGGGNVTGSSQIPPMGPTLARKGVVLASINYRLGALGFLAHPALTAESPRHASGN